MVLNIESVCPEKDTLMKDNGDNQLRKVLELTQEMLQLADDGDADRDDIGCGVLFGALRDSAYKMRALAQSEIEEHHIKGKKNRSRTASSR